MRCACFAIRSKAGTTVAGGATHTRNTVSIPSKHPSRVLGRARSPRTTSTCGGKPAASGLRASALTRARGNQLREDLAADVACGSDDENTIHAGRSNSLAQIGMVQAIELTAAANIFANTLGPQFQLGLSEEANTGVGRRSKSRREMMRS